MHIFLTLLITFFSSQLLADIYSWEDKDGVTHFSETKPKESLGQVSTTLIEHEPSAMIPSLQATPETTSKVNEVLAPSEEKEVTMESTEEAVEQGMPETANTNNKVLTTPDKQVPVATTTIEEVATQNASEAVDTTNEVLTLSEEKVTEATTTIKEVATQNTSEAVETTNAVLTLSEEKVPEATTAIKEVATQNVSEAVETTNAVLTWSEEKE